MVSPQLNTLWSWWPFSRLFWACPRSGGGCRVVACSTSLCLRPPTSGEVADLWVCHRTCSSTEAPRGQLGQASVEAALVLPVLMLVLALLLEPVCMGYTLSVMRGCASELARIALTDVDGDLSECQSFARRRLAAVPEVAPFHVGGEGDWDVRVTREGGRVDVRIRGHLRPLPLLGVIASSFVASDGQGVVLEAEAHESLRPSWLGGSYGGWQQVWG